MNSLPGTVARNGIVASAALLALYFGVVGTLSGWEFAVSEFQRTWYFLVGLAIGFGIQVGLYSYLRAAIRHQGPSAKVVAASGATSTAAMVSCCAHYLANVLPVIGTTGLVAAVAQYQTDFFWLGLAFNAAGIFYIARKVFHFRRSMNYA